MEVFYSRMFSRASKLFLNVKFKLNMVNINYNEVSTVQKMKYSSLTENDQERQAKIMSKGLPKKKEIPGVQNIVLIVSGKGGVGKSTTAVNVSVAMAQKNIKVGLLDADVFGPSVPLMMNLNESPLVNKNNEMIPLTNYGVKCMSMGFLVSEKSAVIWRGLMVMSALNKLLRQVHWGSLDVLIIDTPPGTGDTLLSLLQNIPISGVLIVSTPQLAAVQVARRGASMLQKLQIPIIGLVSNMNTVICPNCNSKLSIFGNTISTLSKELGNGLILKCFSISPSLTPISCADVPVLADIPLDADIADYSDSGRPAVISNPESVQAGNYVEIASKVADYLKLIKRDSN